MLGPQELMVIMAIMLVVVFFGGSGGGPRPPSMRRLQSLLGNRRPLFSLNRPFDGVGACARTPFCFSNRGALVASLRELCYHSLHIV